MTQWQVEESGEVGKRVVTYPASPSTGLNKPAKFVQLKYGEKTLILRSQLRRKGTSGNLLRITGNSDAAASTVDSLKNSGVLRFQVYWLFHSLNGFLELVALALLVTGSVFTGEVGIRTSAIGTPNTHLGSQAWAGFAFGIAAILVGVIREMFTES